MAIYKSPNELIGNTPLVEFGTLGEHYGVESRLLCKLEGYNPAGSVKDRLAAALLGDAFDSGKLKRGGLIVEPTSGNTGIALSALAPRYGVSAVLVMPETMSVERRKLMNSYGAELVLTPGDEGMSGAVKRAKQIAEERGGYMPNQFENRAGILIHYNTTGPEIWRDTCGNLDAVVAGVGTGGTISGVGQYLKERNSGVKIFAVEPRESPVLSGGKAGPHKIAGIGAGFVPKIFDRSVVDEVVCVSYDEARECVDIAAKKEGILVGISSGAAVSAAVKISKKLGRGKTVVAILADFGERYLSVL